MFVEATVVRTTRNKGSGMSKNGEPVVLELASLAREQTGPFLLLGLDKTADKEKVEANWADRVRWARKGQLKVALEDVNWARNELSDIASRLRADAASLNVDLTEAVLGRLAFRFGVGGQRGDLRWKPLDREKSLEGYAPTTELPKSDQIAATVVLPVIADDLPAVHYLLSSFAGGPLDPWDIQLPDVGERSGSAGEERP
jgi:hypothetical protein